MIKLNYENAFVSEEKLLESAHLVKAAAAILHAKKGAGKEYTGWLDLPENYDKDEFLRIKEAAKKIKGHSDALVVIGIGGSYLGAKALFSALKHNFYNEIEKPKIYFAGQNLSPTYLKDLIEVLKDKDFSVNVISKSGTTTESAIAFRIFKSLLEEKYGKEGAKERIFATTDKSKGALKSLADTEGYETFVVPDNVGGRYSVLTAVGLLPLAVCDIDIDKLMEGAYDAAIKYANPNILENPCYQYAIIRNILYRRGKDIEILANYTPKLKYFTEWWKQLFGESEGKDGKGIFPAGVNFTTDLHSMGQMIQDGRRNIFETVLNIEKTNKDIEIESIDEDIDGLNYLANKTLHEINQKAMEGTIMAHVEGGVPNILLSIEELDEYNMGQLVYFFEKACGISGYLLGVNPFNQPGVEKYKSNMFTLLGKPGY
ncbi:MAG: glucose-6-phosphate isomerase [Tissierellia bacterium]|nr:glucose-6-phosphate isomerase [Tissierellia bacterium]